MFDLLPHRRVALVALAALVVLSGAASGVPATADVSPTEIDRSPASTARPTAAAENASATITHDGSRLTVFAAANKEIRGETTAEPGTELIVIVEATNGSFSEPERVTVREDGTFVATFDLRGMNPGSEFAVSVRKNGTVLGRETDARVLEPSAATAEFVYDGERLTLHPTDEQSVQMRTNADPGAELTIELRVAGNLVTEVRAPVTENGFATATFDLRRYEPGTEFAVVAPDGTRAEGVIANASTETASTGANTTIDHEGLIVLRAAPNQTVQIRSDAPAGTDVMVRLRSARYNVLRADEATVGDDGTGTATFDLSRVEPGASFTVTASDADATFAGVVVNESATVHRDATFPVSDPASEYAISGRVVNFVTELDVDLAVGATTRSETVTVAEDGTFAASFDLSSVSSGAEATVEVGGTPRSVSTVVVTEGSADPTAYVLVEPANATIRYPEATLLVHPKADQTVSGTTNLRPGTELVVTAENDDPNSPNAFTRSANVTVRDDGTFVAELNVTGVEPGTNFSVSVEPGLARINGRVVNESVKLPTATTTASTAQPTTDESAFATGTTTPDADNDGFVPGFGAPAALAALLAALALARERRA